MLSGAPTIDMPRESENVQLDGGEKQIPSGNDEKQIPFGNDNKGEWAENRSAVPVHHVENEQ